MNLIYEIRINNVDDNISDEKIIEMLYDMRARLEGYSTEPVEGINYEEMEISFKIKD